MKKMRALFPSMIAFFILLLLFSCSSGTEAEKEDVLKAVKKYNNMMKRAYMEANLNLMKGVTTENQMKMLFATIQALRATDNFMMAEQKSFNVGKISVKKDRAFVEAEETWDYWWQHKDTKEITKPLETLTYTIRYNLVPDYGVWKVDSIENIE